MSIFGVIGEEREDDHDYAHHPKICHNNVS